MIALPRFRAFTAAVVLLVTTCALVSCQATPSGATIVSDAAFRSVLSTIPGITFVTSTPPLSDETSVYFSSFGWPSNRTAQQRDYVSVPVAAMALCLAVQPRGAINVTATPTMDDIAALLLGQSTGASLLRSDWPSVRGVSKVYWAASSTPPLLSSLQTWRGAPYFTSTTVLPSAVSSNSAVSLLPTDADVVAALAADASSVAFLPLIVAVKAKLACLSLKIPTLSGGSEVVAPQLQSSMPIKFSPPSLTVTCPVGVGCYPLLGALVAHVRKRSSMTLCDASTSVLAAVRTITSSESLIAEPLDRWNMVMPPAAAQVATLQELTTATCMPETRIVLGVGSVVIRDALNDWFYQYFSETNGTVFVLFKASSEDAALASLDVRTADFASASPLSAPHRAAYPNLHSFPSIGTCVSLIVNVGQAVSVKLPRCSITSIFNGTIQWWNDTLIEAVNPMLVMPRERIDVAVQVESAEATDMLMGGLRSLDLECFGMTSIAPNALLPSVATTTRLVGTDAMASYVAKTPFSMTWLPYDYANDYSDLNQATIQADDGSVTTPADTQTALDGGTIDDTTSDYTLASQTLGYPFVGVSYLVFSMQVAGGCDGHKVAADFMLWTMTSSSALALAVNNQFLGLSDDVRAATADYFKRTAMCNGSLVYPVPPDALLWWPIVVFVVLVVALSAAVGARAGYRHWVYGARPVDPMLPMAVMFVGVKNQAAVTEAGERNVAAVLQRVTETTRRMVRKHRCYEARRVDAWTTMIVAKTAQAAVSCAEDLVLSLSVDVQWVDDVMVHPLPGAARVRKVTRTRKESATSGLSTSKSSGKSTDSGRKEASRTTHTSSSHTRLTVQQCVPQVYAGVHWAHIMIDHQDDDAVSYFGAGIATAAVVADLAVDGQVVVSREAADAINAEQHSAAANYVFTLLTNTPEDVTALSLTTARFPEWLLARSAARRKSLEEKGSDGGAGNTIAAAMASADGALAKRRIAVVSLLMRDMLRDGAESRAAAVRDALEDLREIVATHRGEIHSITDCVVTVTIGAGGPVAMAAVRAAHIAMEAGELCVAAGVHSGVALVGNAGGGKATTVGRVAAGAALMRLVAQRAKIRVVASDAVHADLTARFQIVTVDLIGSSHQERAKPVIRCYGVAEARVDAGESEWLYEMQDGFASLELRFDALLQGKQAMSKSMSASARPQPPDPSPASTNAFLERHSQYRDLSNALYDSLPSDASESVDDFAKDRLLSLFAFAAAEGCVVL